MSNNRNKRWPGYPLPSLFGEGLGVRPIALIAAMVGLVLCGCNNTKVKITYEHPELYSVGDATIEQPVNSISIDWVAGGVDIRYADSNVFRIREESDSILGDSLQMRYCVTDDGELKIKFCQSGSYRNGRLLDINKMLFVEVPHNVNLDEIEIDMVGGIISYDSVPCRKLNLDVVNVATTVWTPTLPYEIDLDAVKATLRFYVPPTAGMTIEMDGIKTSLDCELPVRKDGKKTTIIGDGSCKVDIDAVSSEVYINKLNNQ